MTRSKTMWFAIALAVAGTLETQIHLLKDNLGEFYGYTYVGIAIIVAALRVVTTQPLNEK